jgi:hypothetical protein
MCYSAQIRADFNRYVGQFGAHISLQRFTELFRERRRDGSWAKIPKAMRDAFRQPESEAGFELAKMVAEGDREQEQRYREELAS